jgi:hypothetical protein
MIVFGRPNPVHVIGNLKDEVTYSSLNACSEIVVISAPFEEFVKLGSAVKTAAAELASLRARFGRATIKRVLIVFSYSSSVEPPHFETIVPNGELTGMGYSISVDYVVEALNPVLAIAKEHCSLLMWVNNKTIPEHSHRIKDALNSQIAVRYGISVACFTKCPPIDYSMKIFLMLIVREMLAEYQSVEDTMGTSCSSLPRNAELFLVNGQGEETRFGYPLLTSQPPQELVVASR